MPSVRNGTIRFIHVYLALLRLECVHQIGKLYFYRPLVQLVRMKSPHDHAARAGAAAITVATAGVDPVKGCACGGQAWMQGALCARRGSVEATSTMRTRGRWRR